MTTLSKDRSAFHMTEGMEGNGRVRERTFVDSEAQPPVAPSRRRRIRPGRVIEASRRREYHALVVVRSMSCISHVQRSR